MHAVDGKVVIITGSGKGIGKGMALHLGKGGAQIVVAEWKEALMAQTCAELDQLGITNHGVVCDIQQRDQIDAMVAQTIERFGRVDGLINNAQTFRPLSPIADVSEDDVDVFYDSGVKGTLVGDASGLPAHPRAGMGSHRQLRVVDGHYRWCRVRRVQRVEGSDPRTHAHRAREWAIDGIVVNAIAPAAATHHGDAGKVSEGYRIFIENCPMKRQGDPELDIGPLAWFLCSDACRYLTGHTFMADGGAFMWA